MDSNKQERNRKSTREPRRGWRRLTLIILILIILMRFHDLIMKRTEPHWRLCQLTTYLLCTLPFVFLIQRYFGNVSHTNGGACYL